MPIWSDTFPRFLVAPEPAGPACLLWPDRAHDVYRRPEGRGTAVRGVLAKFNFSLAEYAGDGPLVEHDTHYR